jgi:hypothetical protein
MPPGVTKSAHAEGDGEIRIILSAPFAKFARVN